MANTPEWALNHRVGRAFDRLARWYDTPWLQQAFYRPPQDAVVDVLRSHQARRVLDVACGTGILADRIQRELTTDVVVGVDASVGMLANARKRSSAVQWLVGSAEELPMPDDSVDAVTTTTAFHFFDQPAALREFYRVLAPGGVVVLGTITAPLPTPAPLRRLLEGHLSAYHPTPGELRNLLRDAGFEHLKQNRLQSWAGKYLLYYRITIGVKPTGN